MHINEIVCQEPKVVSPLLCRLYIAVCERSERKVETTKSQSKSIYSMVINEFTMTTIPDQIRKYTHIKCEDVKMCKREGI